MIRGMTVVKAEPKEHVVPWVPKVVPAGTTVTFQPGLNVIFGPNGCGKSTILMTLARLLCCARGNVQTIAMDEVRVFTSDDTSLYVREDKPDASPLKSVWAGSDSVRLKTGVALDHDGSPTMHFDPSKAVCQIVEVSALSQETQDYLRDLESRLGRAPVIEDIYQDFDQGARNRRGVFAADEIHAQQVLQAKELQGLCQKALPSTHWTCQVSSDARPVVGFEVNLGPGYNPQVLFWINHASQIQRALEEARGRAREQLRLLTEG